ncbi:hypothetical protein [Gordonia insulae]|uniref:Pullulanase n=1 Tax=Gordonia insulae TaxID=2420509 RepID=A0A3G8JRA2_9ACTN|nr:hypothetical protein [Gordonia insulae]AZG47002.1 hypothetical protein D7316_03607 [Gordonia insulae]
MDSAIEYLFGMGDGHTTSWVSAADADLDSDGTDDAVTLDFDGDGQRDDAMWDTDGDGRADVAVIDRDDDGRPDEFFRDTGTGVWGQRVAGPAPDPAADEPEIPPAPGRVADPVPEHGAPPIQPAPPSSNDAVVVRSEDLDGDGTADIEVIGSRRAGIPTAQRLYIDEDGDGRYDRVLIDENGDGRADVSFDDRSPRFDRR